MSDANQMFSAFIVMIVFILLGLVLNIAVVTPMDRIHEEFLDKGMMDVSAEWVAGGTLTLLYDLANFLVYACYFIGPSYFLFSTVNRQRYDEYSQMRRY